MIPVGTLVNVVMVVIGSFLGLTFQKIISPSFSKKVFFFIGLFTLGLGFSMCVQSMDFILILVSILFGTALGYYYNIDNFVFSAMEALKNKIHINDEKFTEGLLTAFMLFCIGSMTIVGSIEEGLGKGATTLYTKSIMDGISSVILSATFGVGVLFSIFPMFLFQVTITLVVFYYRDFVPEELIDHINSVGGVLIIGIGLKIVGVKLVKPINMLPSLIFIVIFYIIKLHILS